MSNTERQGNVIGRQIDYSEELNDHPSVSSTSGSQQPRRRGRAKATNAQKYKEEHGTKVPVQFSNEHGKFIGMFGGWLSRSIGVLVRHWIPLSVETYIGITPAMREGIDLRILEEYILDFSNPKLRRCVNDIVNDRYKEYRSELHKYYKEKKEQSSAHEARADKHDSVESMDDWKMLCDRWETPRFQNISTKNSENRSKIPYLHKSGSKPFTTKFQEMREVNPAFHEVDLFQAVYSNSDGVWSNDRAKSDYQQMAETLEASQQQNENEAEEDSSVDRPPRQTPREVLINFLGHRPGYIKGMGKGPKPPSRSGGSSSSCSHYQESQRVEELERALATERERREEYVTLTEARLKEQDDKIAMFMAFMSKSQQPPPHDDHL